MGKETFYIVENDTLPSIQAQLLDPFGDPIDLTGASSVTMYVELPSTTTSFTMTVDDATDGQVSYAWQAADWNTLVVGTHRVVFQIANGTQTVPNSRFGYICITEDLTD